MVVPRRQISLPDSEKLNMSESAFLETWKTHNFCTEPLTEHMKLESNEGKVKVSPYMALNPVLRASQSTLHLMSLCCM